MISKVFKNNAGFSIIEVLVSLGMMLVMGFGLLSLIVAQTKEIKYLQDTMAKVTLEATLLRAFAMSDICTHILSDPSQSPTSPNPNRSKNTIDTSTATLLGKESITIQRIPSSAAAAAITLAGVGGPAAANGSKLQIAFMVFDNFRDNGPNKLLADFNLGFVPDSTGKPIPPIKIPNLFLNTNPAHLATAKGIVSCSGSGGGGGGGGHIGAKIYKGQTSVTYNNGNGHSNESPWIYYPAGCVNPKIFIQGRVDSIHCGDTVGIQPCPSNPGTNSQDINAYLQQVTGTYFTVFYSAENSVFVGASSPAYPIDWMVACD